MTLSGDGTITGLVAGGLPDATVIDADLSLTANSAQVKVALNASGDAPIYACRAWVNFDGTKDTTGATSTANTNRLIRASGNVTSVLRNGAGDYTVNFTTAMPDADYVAGGCGISGGGGYVLRTSSVTLPTSSAFRFSTVDPGVAVSDNPRILVSFHR
jgi:hypothetical protein